MDKKTLRKYKMFKFLNGIKNGIQNKLRQMLFGILWTFLDMPIRLVVALSSLIIPIVCIGLVVIFLSLFIGFFMWAASLIFTYSEVVFGTLVGVLALVALFVIIKLCNRFGFWDFIDKHTEKYDKWCADFLVKFKLAERIVPKFVKERKVDEKMEKFVNTRSKYSGTALANMMPIIHKLHTMNVGINSIHVSYLSDRFFDDEINEILENDYSDSQVASAIKFWRNKDQKDKISFMRYLFMFAVLEDGIHKDEWYMLTDMLVKLKISRYYIDLLKRDYASLRTEFEEWEKRSTSTEEVKTTSTLKAYYATLGLEESATDEEVKKAYHALALQHHPDLPKNADRIQECEAMMAKINEAYEKIRG